MEQSKLISIVLIISVVLIFLVATKGLTDFSRFSDSNGRVKFDLYVMSQCPYGNQAEQQVNGMIDKLGKYVDLNIKYIGNFEDGKLESLHGDNEVKGDIIQLCVAKYYNDKLLDFINCQNTNTKAIPNNWQQCASNLGFDTTKLNSCYSSDEGLELIKDSFAESNKKGVSGSPTVYINNKEYSGSRDSLSFMIAACSDLGSVVECKDLPECETDSQCKDVADKEVSCVANKCVYTTPVPFVVTILNDKTCSSCDMSQITGTFKNMFKGVNFNLVDVNTDAGRNLIKTYNIIYVPAYIVSKDVDKTNFWKNNPRFAGYFDFIDGAYYLSNSAVGSKHFVDEKLKGQFMKSINVSLGDNKPQIDFFVMSFCPYGNQAEELIYETYKNLGDKVEFKPHYVFYLNYQGGGSKYCFDNESNYCSMHGVQEANQDIRELCVEKYYGIESWFKFAVEINKKCDYSNADSCWINVADSLGLDNAKIKTCYENERLQLGAEQLRLSNLFGVGGSPTVFVDGEEYGGARTANGYQAALCSAFSTKPSECSNVISESSQTGAVNNNAGCGA